ncbi:MAG: amino acid adenylation domain-containing protein, partial [Gemmatimonadaceae bacterium]
MQQTETIFDPFAGPAIERVMPTTPAQREIWESALMGADASVAYNEAIQLRMRGRLDLSALRAALAALVARHESLRGLLSPDGMSMLVTEPTAPALGWHDWSNQSRAESERELVKLGELAVTTPFVLEQGPLVRFDLAVLAPDDHALLISAHHIVCDGWSFGVIVQNFATMYESFRLQRTSQLPPAELFSDYAASLNTSEVLTDQTTHDAYWLSEYQTVPDPLEMPTNEVRAGRRSYASRRVDLMLPLDLTSALKQLGASNGCSLFVTLLAGYSALVSRLTQQDDLVVGVASAGQALAGRDQLVGHCVNTLPIRLHPVGTQTFAEWLLRVRTKYFDAFDHQAFGLGRLLERVAFRRAPGRAPLVSLMFNLDRILPSSALAFGDLDVTMQSVPRRAENFELFLNILESPDGLLLECQYNTELFDEATVRRWLSAYELLLRAAIIAPNTGLSRLPVVTDDDQSVLAQCNDSARVWSAEGVVHALIEARAALHPDHVAVEQDNVTLSYGELNARSNQLAHHLRASGVARGAFVGVAVTRTPNLLVAVLGVLKAGAAYVPLDPWLPVARLAGMAADANLAAVVTESAVREAADIPAPITVSLDGDASRIADAPAHNPALSEQSAGPDDTAYVIFTSGSTGKPKGVEVPHSAVVNLLLSVQETPGMTSDDIVLAITTLGFDVAVAELVLPLTVGARIVLATRETASDGAELREVIESRGVTFVCATPASYRMLLAAGWKGNSELRIVCTGEAMPRELAVTLVACAREVWNGYGPTETTVWSTFYRVQSPVERVLIGRPIANTLIAIRDQHGERVPVGVPGEMFIGGAGVATGYLNRPELTEERFTLDAQVPGLRWYRTGDLVRLLPNAELECLGRADDQIKIRGYRIEPGEIAVAVSRWPGVQQATVIARQDQLHDVRLVAYVVTDNDTTFDESFRAHLKVSLPDYMIPAAVVRLAAMPLNASGKIDRKRLPAPDASSVVSSDAYVAPRTDTERLLAGLWTQALAMARVGMRDDFFALGGHSLLASQILARLRRDHGIQLTFRRIFEAPTIEALARIIDEERRTDTPPLPIDNITHRAGVTDAPLSPLQHRIWMLNELDPDAQPAYNHAASWYLNGALNEVALAQALKAVIRRHPMLRTSFRVENGEGRQSVQDDVEFALSRIDLRQLSPEQRDAAIETYFAAQQRIPFDVGVAPLFRASLITLTPDRHLLYTLQNGLIWDGWSFDIFLRDVVAHYEAIVNGLVPGVAELPVTYGDFSEWQRSWLAGPEAAGHRAWWDGHLNGTSDALELPIDFARSTKRLIEGAHVALTIDKDDLAEIQALGRQNDCTLFMVMMSAYNVWLHLVCHQQSVLVAAPMRARIRPELETLLGPFVNTVVFRTDIAPDATFASVLRNLRNVTLDALTHQALPFEQLSTPLPPIRALFSLQDARDRPVAMGSL